MTSLIPTPKVATGGITGIVTAFIFYELSNRFNITLAPEESSLITTIISVVAAYFAPHSEPTDEQKTKILADQCPPDPKTSNLSTQWADPTTPL